MQPNGPSEPQRYGPWKRLSGRVVSTIRRVPSPAAQTDIALPRLWCVAASHAPIVAVLARCYGEPRWTCLLRWNWKARTVEEGAWTTMHIRAHRCTLSPDGEFFLYHAEGPTDGPFSGFFGGAFAVSRVPWFSALTNPRTWGPGGGGESRDALTDSDQETLWAMFKEWPAYVRDEHWPRHLGPGWTSLVIEHAATLGIQIGGRGHLAAISELGGTDLSLVAVVDAGRSKWSVWHDDIRYFLISRSAPSRPPQFMQGTRWLHAAEGGHLLLADDQAVLKVVRFDHKNKMDQVPTTVFEHSIQALTPTPRAAPAWAKAPLSSSVR